MGIQRSASDLFSDGAGPPENIQRILATFGANVHAGWNTKPATPAMREFRDRLLWATTAGQWTPGGMAAKHMRHFLEGTGLPYRADMQRALESPKVNAAYEALIRDAVAYASGRPTGCVFHQIQATKISPRSAPLGEVADPANADAWYAFGTFQGWVEGTVLATGVELRLHLLDIYDFDQTNFALPIPGAMCAPLKSPFARALVEKAIGELASSGALTVDTDTCKVTSDDSLLNDLHLMGLAKNYITRGMAVQVRR